MNLRAIKSLKDPYWPLESSSNWQKKKRKKKRKKNKSKKKKRKKNKNKNKNKREKRKKKNKRKKKKKMTMSARGAASGDVKSYLCQVNVISVNKLLGGRSGS